MLLFLQAVAADGFAIELIKFGGVGALAAGLWKLQERSEHRYTELALGYKEIIEKKTELDTRMLDTLERIEEVLANHQWPCESCPHFQKARGMAAGQ